VGKNATSGARKGGKRPLFTMPGEGRIPQLIARGKQIDLKNEFLHFGKGGQPLTTVGGGGKADGRKKRKKIAFGFREKSHQGNKAKHLKSPGKEAYLVFKPLGKGAKTMDVKIWGKDDGAGG